MDFIKKNWAKLAQSLLYAFGGALALFAMIQAIGNLTELKDLAAGAVDYNKATLVVALVYGGALVGFFGFAITQLLKGLAPRFTKYGFLITGAICTVMFFIAICMVGRMDVLGGNVMNSMMGPVVGLDEGVLTGLNAKDAAAFMGVLPTFWTVYAPFLFFGLAPLVKGLRRFIHKETDEIAVEAKKPAAVKATPAK